jgi:hypothetical protein
MTTLVTPLGFISLEPAIKWVSGPTTIQPDSGQQFDMNGKSTLSLHIQWSGGSVPSARTFNLQVANAPATYAQRLVVAPDLFIGDAVASGSGVQISNTASGKALVVWKDVAFRYFDLDDAVASLGFASGTTAYISVYAR